MNFPKIYIYILKDSTRIPIECDELFVQINPETRLKIIPHAEKDALIFQASSINDQDDVVEDRRACIVLNLRCANSVALQMDTRETRRGELLMQVPTYGYQKLFSVSGQQRNYLFEASPDRSKQDENKLTIQFNDENELRIELFQSWNVNVSPITSF
ncbi:MAG: hypothetical protein P4M12_12605 [Gammaproteobacteria bacterium]|nr:hypothetical protein [Gammaproteobacteria bacterium]